jgi:hypothetical protein
MTNTLYTLRQQLARLMGETILGVPSVSPARLQTDSFGVPALAVYEDDYFLDWQGRFYEGTHKGTNFVVTASTAENGVLTFAPSLSEAVVVGDLFEIYQEFTPEELNDAINLAISMVEDTALEDAVDESLEAVASTYEYAVPTGIAYIEQIFQEEGTANRYGPTDNLRVGRHWRMLRGPTPKIWFDPNYVSLTAGRNLRLVGQKRPSELSLDADISKIDKAYIIYQAKALMHQSRIRGRGADFEEHNAQMVVAQGMADREKGRLAVPGRGQKVSF